jgi:hypothetical protein
MIGKVSTAAGYLAIFCAGTAVGLAMLAFTSPTQAETIARLAYIAAVAAFCCFTFWAVSATLTALRRTNPEK